MKATVIGHMWEEHYLYAQGKGRSAIRKEATAPGGAWWLTEVLNKAGISISLEEISSEKIRKEYYDCSELPLLGGGRGVSQCVLHYSGCVEGQTLLEPQTTELTIVLDEGFENLKCPDGCELLLWASKARIPNNKTTAIFPDHSVILLDVDVLRRCGALISHQISWERTATDTVWQLANNPLF